MCVQVGARAAGGRAGGCREVAGFRLLSHLLLRHTILCYLIACLRLSYHTHMPDPSCASPHLSHLFDYMLAYVRTGSHTPSGRDCACGRPPGVALRCCRL